jgi:hypothetical protein
MRDLEELLVDDDEAWPKLKQWAADGRGDAELVESDRADGERVLTWLQVTTRSTLGSLAFYAAVVFVDSRWVRVLGAGGSSAGASLLDPVPGGSAPPPPRDDALIIASDALGGVFVVNGGGLPGERGEVSYLAPDTLQFEGLEMGNTDFVRWLFAGDLEQFYAGKRWKGWQDDVAALDASRGIHTYPPLFTEDGRDIESVSRKPVPMGELWSIWLDAREQLGSDLA